MTWAPTPILHRISSVVNHLHYINVNYWGAGCAVCTDYLGLKFKILYCTFILFFLSCKSTFTIDLLSFLRWSVLKIHRGWVRLGYVRLALEGQVRLG